MVFAMTLMLLYAAAVSAAQPREGAEYALKSNDGAYLSVDEVHGLRLVSLETAGETRKFKFVRAEDELVYLQFGEVLLTAYNNAGEAEPLFRLFSRPKDGKVALLVSSEGTGLRGGRGGTIEQGKWSSTDEAMWWWLLPATLDAERSCPAEGPPQLGAPNQRFSKLRGSKLPSGVHPTPVRLGRAATTPRRVVTSSAAVTVLATAAMLPAGTFTSLGASTAAAVPGLAALASTAHGLTPVALQRVVFSLVGWIAHAGGALRTAGLSHPLASVLLHGLLVGGASDLLAQSISHANAAADGASSTSLVLNWRRVQRTAWTSFLTDDVPFVIWAKFLWDAFEKLKPMIAGSTVLVGAASLLLAGHAQPL